eukprot:742721-Amorphochlora_amoeboformis.AAC.1
MADVKSRKRAREDGGDEDKSSTKSTKKSIDGPSIGKDEKRRIIVVLQKAALETIKTKKGYELVTADSHKTILLRMKKDPSAY